MHSAKTGNTCLMRGRNKNIGATGMLPENIIGTTAYKKTGLLRGQLTDHITLHFEKRVITKTILGR